MKKTLLIVLLIFITHLCHSQEILNSLFEFRLGMNEKQLREIVDITLLTEDRASLSSSDKRLGNRKKIYHLKEYILKKESLLFPDYKIQNIYFHFFDDKLYQIKISSYSLRVEDILSIKYGGAKETVEESEAGDILDDVIIKDWETNDPNIKCASTRRMRKGSPNIHYYSLTLLDFNTYEELIKEKMSIE